MPIVLIFILSIEMVTQLYSSADQLKFPVLLYIIIIAVMGVAAFGRWDAFQTQSSFYVAMGASIFMISDSVLGWNKFKNSFPVAEAIILSTYYLGQGMIAYSTI